MAWVAPVALVELGATSPHSISKTFGMAGLTMQIQAACLFCPSTYIASYRKGKKGVLTEFLSSFSGDAFQT